MIGNWFKKHALRITIYTVVTTSMVLYYGSLIPAWIFYTLLIAMHVWIFSNIGVRIYKYTKRKQLINNK